MHKCSSSHGNPVGSCSCGMFHAPNNSFSMLFSMSNHHQQFDEVDAYPITSSSSSVDCTLSLGTPSTRQTDEKSIGHQRRSGSCVSNLCWDIFQTNKKPPSSASAHKSSSRGGISGNNMNGGDPLLTRRCTNCDTTSTPLWRNGPRGPKSLCNACGIRYKKEERRATTTTANSAATANIIESNHLMSQHHQYSWAHSAQTQGVPSMSHASFGNEFRFIEDNDGETDNSRPFLSWRLNVPDRSNLVHDYT